MAMSQTPIILRDYCVTRSCFVVLRSARLWISNGHPASVVVKNQLLATIENSQFSALVSFEPGGRRFESLRARIL